MPPPRQILLLLLSLHLLVTTIVTDEFNEPITSKEEFEQLFNATEPLKSDFHSRPSLAYLFARNTIGKWLPLVPYCVAELFSQTSAQVHPTCFEQVLDLYNTKIKLGDIRLVYRCFKGDNNNYDLHTASVDIIEKQPMDVILVHFTPQQSTDDCQIHPFEKDPELILKQAKELSLASATKGVTPLNREAFEAALRNSSVEAKWLTYIFQRNQMTLSTELEPFHECVVKLIREGTALVPQFCGVMLNFYRSLSEKLRNCVLPIRCYHHDNATEYDLQVVPIEDVLLDSPFFVITYTRPKSHTCTPVWANDAEVRKAKHDLKAEHQQYLASLTKDRFEGAFTEFTKMPKLLPYLGFIFYPHQNTTEKILAPIPNCQVMLFSSDTALLGPECISFIKLFANVVSNLSTWDTLLLAYRCYLVDSPNEYELHVVNLEKLGEQPKEDYQYVHFKAKESDQCRAMWLEELVNDDGVDHLQLMEHTEL